jgi:hypothetical protein
MLANRLANTALDTPARRRLDFSPATEAWWSTTDEEALERDRLTALERDPLESDDEPRSLESSPPAPEPTFHHAPLSSIYYVEGETRFDREPILSDVKLNVTVAVIESFIGSGVLKQNPCLLLRCQQISKKASHFIYLYRKLFGNLQLYVELVPIPSLIKKRDEMTDL